MLPSRFSRALLDSFKTSYYSENRHRDRGLMVRNMLGPPRHRPSTFRRSPRPRPRDSVVYLYRYTRSDPEPNRTRPIRYSLLQPTPEHTYTVRSTCTTESFGCSPLQPPTVRSSVHTRHRGPKVQWFNMVRSPSLHMSSPNPSAHTCESNESFGEGGCTRESDVMWLRSERAPSPSHRPT